jgi:hypothetical protein
MSILDDGSTSRHPIQLWTASYGNRKNKLTIIREVKIVDDNDMREIQPKNHPHI